MLLFHTAVQTKLDNTHVAESRCLCSPPNQANIRPVYESGDQVLAAPQDKELILNLLAIEKQAGKNMD